MENVLLEHLYNMQILRPNHPSKKKDAILDNLIGILARENIHIEEIKNFIFNVNEDKVLDTSVFDIGGNIENFINPIWTKLLLPLWRFRSVGLGTPNAASGEGEFMFLFSSKHISKPVKGDLLVKGEIIEIKGEETRVLGKITGNKFREKVLEICKSFNLSPNQSMVGRGGNKKLIEAVELEKLTHKEYWTNELGKLSAEDQKKFINEWLYIIDSKKHDVDVFLNGKFNQGLFIKEIVKILYMNMLSNSNFSKFVILGNGKDIKILSRNINDFVDKINKNIIIPKCDYFRINQDLPIGWYIN